MHQRRPPHRPLLVPPVPVARQARAVDAAVVVAVVVDLAAVVVEHQRRA